MNVVDTTAPLLFVPANLTAQATSSAGAQVLFTATAQDRVDGSVGVTCTPPSGATFAIGRTTVVCTASDSRGNDATASLTITVVDAPPPADSEAPVFVSISATPNVLQPPNGKLVDVTLTAEVTDNIDPAPLVRIFDVTANENIGSDDRAFAGTLGVALRASRNPQGTGRIYTIHLEAIDASGNRGTGSVNVSVPHDSSSGDSNVVPSGGKRRSVRP